MNSPPRQVPTEEGVSPALLCTDGRADGLQLGDVTGGGVLFARSLQNPAFSNEEYPSCFLKQWSGWGPTERFNAQTALVLVWSAMDLVAPTGAQVGQ